MSNSVSLLWPTKEGGLFSVQQTFTCLAEAFISLNYLKLIYYGPYLHKLRPICIKTIAKTSETTQKKQILMTLGLSEQFDPRPSVITALQYTQQWEDNAPVGIRAVVKSSPCFVFFILSPSIDTIDPLSSPRKHEIGFLHLRLYL